MHVILPVYFSTHQILYKKDDNDDTGENQKGNSQLSLGYRHFTSTFLHSQLVIQRTSPSIHKQPVSFNDSFGALSRLGQGEKRRFLVPNLTLPAS
jgi:hypothetical protein